MTIAKNKIAYLIALSLPFIVLGYIALSTYHKHNSGELWHVEVTGYDPRDLIHGRFLRYRISWSEYGTVSRAQKTSDALCLMRNAADPRIPSITQIKAEAIASARCDSLLIAGSAEDHWNILLRKYYIPEEYADALDWAFGQTHYKFAVDLRISDKGTLSVTDLYVNGEVMHKAMPALKAAYSGTKTGDRLQPHTWRLKVKDLTPYYVSEEQNCVTYNIDWPYYGIDFDPYKATPHLCFMPSSYDEKTPVLSLITPQTDQNACRSIAESTPWNRNSWNNHTKIFCQSAALGKFLIEQSKIKNTYFEVENTINNRGDFYSTELFIYGLTLKEAMEESAASNAP
tara:strand:+ start:172582 stop:173607 length:1026 start_codon:yes stop_codon:yes gene_type:complete